MKSHDMAWISPVGSQPCSMILVDTSNGKQRKLTEEMGNGLSPVSEKGKGRLFQSQKNPTCINMLAFLYGRHSVQ